MTLREKLETLAKLIEEQQLKQLSEDKLDCEANKRNKKTSIIEGKKYVKIDVGGSGHIMVDIKTEVIYGIKAYGVIHKGHRYGTLDTINEYYWGRFYPQKRAS